eukprot:jgi/Undpi1/1885/HiC_scaffold_12.g05272.m1
MTKRKKQQHRQQHQLAADPGSSRVAAPADRCTAPVVGCLLPEAAQVESMRATRMYLLQTKGPTRFVIRGEESDRKYTVLVGSRAQCSCGVTLCLHHLFVMIKVLKVPPTNPLAWQTALIDSEVDCILRHGCGNGKAGRGGDDAPGDRGRGEIGSPAGRREFLRRGGGRTSSGGSVVGGAKDVGGSAEVGDGAGAAGGGTRRQEIVLGEVCPVCQEQMEGGGDEEREEGATTARAGLTYCRNGCGNNMHARCMLMYAEHRRSSGDKVNCPLCRVDWGISAVRALRKDAFDKNHLHLAGPGQGGISGLTAVAHAGVVPVTCRSCNVKAANDPPEWAPAEPLQGGRRHGSGMGGGASGRSAAAGVLSLQGREITTADFELLLTLDVSPAPPLHEHLLQALPPCDGLESDTNDMCLLPAPPQALQSRPVQSALVPPRHPQRVPPAPAVTPERVDLSSSALEVASLEGSTDGGVGAAPQAGVPVGEKALASTHAIRVEDGRRRIASRIASKSPRSAFVGDYRAAIARTMHALSPSFSKVLVGVIQRFACAPWISRRFSPRYLGGGGGGSAAAALQEVKAVRQQQQQQQPQQQKKKQKPVTRIVAISWGLHV